MLKYTVKYKNISKEVYAMLLSLADKTSSCFSITFDSVNVPFSEIDGKIIRAASTENTDSPIIKYYIYDTDTMSFLSEKYDTFISPNGYELCFYDSYGSINMMLSPNEEKTYIFGDEYYQDFIKGLPINSFDEIDDREYLTLYTEPHKLMDWWLFDGTTGINDPRIPKYTASDYDYSKNLDCHISGNELSLLFDKCFEYSTVFSMIYDPTKLNASEYDKYIIKSGEAFHWPGAEEKTHGVGYIKYFKCCAETKEMLLVSVNNLFDLSYNPGDICFYREDGSVLLASDIGNAGECWLFPRETESFDEVFQAINWVYSEYSTKLYNKNFNNIKSYMTKKDFTA